jgi:alkaline phosphatase D
MRAYPSLRRFVPLTAALVALLTVAPPAGANFDLGVGAFDVTRTGATLWTRADQPGTVTLEVATSPADVTVLTLTAKASDDMTVQRRVGGLKPGTRYSYRFGQGGRLSGVGHFRTAPSKSSTEPIHFGLSGDADAQRAQGQSQPFYNGLPGNNGFGAESFGVYREMALERNAFNVNLGDTIYSDTEVGGVPTARTVAQKWAKYRQNLGLANLRRLRASAAMYNHWDDHEFINDFTKAENGTAIYEAGKTAFEDYMPARFGDLGLYMHQRWGKNLEIFKLDERSFRSAKASANHTCDNQQSHQPDLAPTAPQDTRNLFAVVVPSLSAPVAQRCKDRINSPTRTMLGKPQLERFLDDVDGSSATWKVVINEVPIQQFYALPYDRWEGYEAERRQLLRSLQRRLVKNLVFVTTDTHANMLNVVRFRTLESGGPVPSQYREFVTGPVSTKTFRREIDEATGGEGNGNLVDAAFFSPPPPNGVGMSCSNVDVYSYAEVTARPDLLRIEAKDVHGNVVRDQSDGVTPCVTLLTPRH